LKPPEESDALQRFVFEHARVRGELVRLDGAWREAHGRRDYPEAVRNALGELTAASVLLAATVKFADGALVLQIQGGAPLTLLVVECRSDRTFRSTARWQEDGIGDRRTLAELATGGRCAITIDPGGRLAAYQGIVPLEGATTAESLERYMARSEQLETLFALAADEDRAAGLLLQKLPEKGGHPGVTADPDLWNRVSHLLRTLTREELLTLPEREILRRLFHDEGLRLFESVPVRFACRCTRERVARLIRMMGAEEAHAVLEERGRIDVHCEFCGEGYTFDRGAAEEALAARRQGPPPASG
jgi:molecular chaperone Hsp33